MLPRFLTCLLILTSLSLPGCADPTTMGAMAAASAAEKILRSIPPFDNDPAALRSAVDRVAKNSPGKTVIIAKTCVVVVEGNQVTVVKRKTIPQQSTD